MIFLKAQFDPDNLHISKELNLVALMEGICLGVNFRQVCMINNMCKLIILGKPDGVHFCTIATESRVVAETRANPANKSQAKLCSQGEKSCIFDRVMNHCFFSIDCK